MGFLGLSPAATEEKLGGGDWPLKERGDGGPFFLAGDTLAVAYEDGACLSEELEMGTGALVDDEGGGVCLGLATGLGICMAFCMN